MSEKAMSARRRKWLERLADYIIPLVNVALMLALWFLTSLPPLYKIAGLVMILLIGNVIKYELKRKLAAAARQD